MTPLRIATFALLATTVGCAATNNQRAHLDPAAMGQPDSLRMWSRPQEVGYTIGDEIKGEATSTSILFGLLTLGAEEGGGVLAGVGELFGVLKSGHEITDPLVRSAAGVAMNNGGAGVDGIYVTHYETNTINVLIFKRRTATVRGRALSLKTIGEVSEDRADKERFLRAMSGSGGVQVQVPQGIVGTLTGH